MLLLRSGLVLFISVSVAASIIGFGLLYVGGGTGSAHSFAELLTPISYLSAISLTTCIVLICLAWRGRQQPMGDGIIAINLLVLGYCFIQFIQSAVGPRFADSEAMFVWVDAGLYLACLVPAYLVSYLILRRTPLLRGLAPPVEKQRARQASPSNWR